MAEVGVTVIAPGALGKLARAAVIPNRVKDAFTLTAGLTAASCGTDQKNIKSREDYTTTNQVLGTVNQGDSLTSANGRVKVTLLDVQVNSDGGAAGIFGITDSSGNLLDKTRVNDGQKYLFQVEDKVYVLTGGEVAPGYSFGAKWAKLELSEVASGTPQLSTRHNELDVGTGTTRRISAPIQDFLIEAPDIELASPRELAAGGKNKAVLKFYALDRELFGLEKVPEGGSVIIPFADGNNYKITAHDVVPGYTFGASYIEWSAEKTSEKPNLTNGTITNQGESITVSGAITYLVDGKPVSSGPIILTLNDLELGNHAAMFTISDKIRGKTIVESTVKEGESQKITLPDGRVYSVECNGTYSGYMYNVKAAKLHVKRAQ